MELFELLRSRMVWTAIAAVGVVAGLMVLVWPAVGLALLIGLLAVGALAACVYALYELAVTARTPRHGDGAGQEPAVRITRAPDAESARTPADRR